MAPIPALCLILRVDAASASSRATSTVPVYGFPAEELALALCAEHGNDARPPHWMLQRPIVHMALPRWSRQQDGSKKDALSNGILVCRTSPVCR